MSKAPRVFVCSSLRSPQIPSELFGKGNEKWRKLARMLAANIRRCSSGRTAVVLRPSADSKLAIAGWFSEAEAEHIRTAVPWFASALSRLQYVDYAQAEADCIHLAEILRDRLPNKLLETASFVGIPRGGTVVLGLLSYVMDLDHSQIGPIRFSTGPLVVVDDCFLSGARLAQFLGDHPSPSTVIAAGLYAHPDLRTAVEREQTRIQACVTARDLTDHAPSIYGDEYEAWKARWEDRETDPGYWTGIPEHLCFSWSEPDYGVWNARTDRVEQAWRVVPPDHCLKTRFEAFTDAEASVQIQRPASGKISVPSTVFYAIFDDRILVGGSRSDKCLELDGTAAAMWHALVEQGTVEDTLEVLLDTYSVDRPTLRADLLGFMEQLAANDLLHVPDGVYGLSVATDLDLIPRLPVRADPADLHVVAADAPLDLESQDPLYSSPTQAPDTAPATRLYRVGDRFAFRFAGVAEFTIGPDEIEYVLHDDTYAYGLELWLLGTVLAFWLEWRGVPALHASAASVDGNAVGFLASKQGGKSTLAMALLQQGRSLLTDDILAVDVDESAIHGRPGYPQMRMWPGHARHFVEDPESLRPAHPYIDKRRVPIGPDGIGSFCDEPRPLKALYLPERADGAPIEIQTVAPTDALQAVLRHSFLPRLVEATGWQSDRLGTLAQLVKQIPVRRLTYPSGPEHLPRIADAILDAEA